METINYKEHEINIVYDTDSESPRDWDNLGTIYAPHRNYNFSDKESYNAAEDENFKGVILPLYMIDHSGIALSISPFGCPWDSGQVGIIYCSEEVMKKESLSSREQTIKCLTSEVETYSDYVQGNVYGYQIEGELCDDSCYGFMGDTDYMVTEAKSQIDYCIKEQSNKREALRKII